MKALRIIGVALALLANTATGWAQTATLLPNAIQQYFDNNGKVLANGKVYFYIPSTLTPKTVWTTSDESVPQPQPVPLGISGRPGNPIYGDGSYRQIVQDQFGNTIWDYVTSSTGGGSSGGGVPSSEGIMVGTIIAWTNTTLPSRYLYTAGQAISRSTYSALFTALTWNISILCSTGVATISVSTSISDSVPIGAPVEFSCFAPGTTVISKSSGQLTLSSNATATTSANGYIFPWGNGDGSTTFNVPDLRGRTLAGRDNMNGTIAGRLTASVYGSNPDANNATGGAQSFTMTTGYMASHSHGVTDPGHSHQIVLGNSATPGTVALQGSANQVNETSSTATTGISIQNSGGGIAISASVVNSGSGYTNGTQLLTLTGGTCTTQPQFNVTVSGGVVSAPTLATPGSCTVSPTNPAATSGGGGTGATLSVTYSPLPISLIQPTITSDYIIKALPDDSPTGPGVSSIGGMTGAIACGANIACTGNTISINITPTSAIGVGTTLINGGSSGRVLFDNAGALGEYPITGTNNVVMSNNPTLVAPAIGAATAASIAINGCTIGANVFCGAGTAAITSNGAQALVVGPNGGTNPTFVVDASTASAATGLSVKSRAAGSALNLSVLSSGTNESLTIDAKGSGGINIASISTGNITLSQATQATAGLTVSTSFTATGLVGYSAFASAALATAAQYYAGTANTIVPTSVIYPSEVAVTFGATTTFDFSTFLNASVTLTGNITTQTLSNVKAGQSGMITFIQDGTGSRTTVWNSIFKWAGGAAPSLSTAANAVDVLTYSCRSATFCVASLIKGVQ